MVEGIHVFDSRTFPSIWKCNSSRWFCLYRKDFAKTSDLDHGKSFLKCDRVLELQRSLPSEMKQNISLIGFDATYTSINNLLSSVLQKYFLVLFNFFSASWARIRTFNNFLRTSFTRFCMTARLKGKYSIFQAKANYTFI